MEGFAKPAKRVILSLTKNLIRLSDATVEILQLRSG